MRILAALTLLFSAADHWTTYLCLHAPIEGFLVSEANPISDWIFQRLGLVPGLILDSVLTVLALGFLLATQAVPAPVKRVFLGVVLFWTGYAVVNNLRAIETMGLTPLLSPLGSGL